MAASLGLPVVIPTYDPTADVTAISSESSLAEEQEGQEEQVLGQ